MKVTPVHSDSGTYPPKRTGGLTSLLLGASVAIGAAFACSPGEPEETTPRLPPGPGPTALTEVQIDDGTLLASAHSPTDVGLGTFTSEKDSDGDGVPDSRDRCPTVKGHPRYHGCPHPPRIRGRIARPHHP